MGSSIKPYPRGKIIPDQNTQGKTLKFFLKKINDASEHYDPKIVTDFFKTKQNINGFTILNFFKKKNTVCIQRNTINKVEREIGKIMICQRKLI